MTVAPNGATVMLFYDVRRDLAVVIALPAIDVIASPAAAIAVVVVVIPVIPALAAPAEAQEIHDHLQVLSFLFDSRHLLPGGSTPGTYCRMHQLCHFRPVAPSADVMNDQEE